MPSLASANTPFQFILGAEDYFREAGLCFGQGTDNARDEAAFLVLRALDLPFDAEEAQLDRPLSGREKQLLGELVRERVEHRRPLAYILNEAWFCGLSFYVDERVLIPRSPIAELVLERFSPWAESDRLDRILDMGTGSGCIAIACALAMEHARVDAVDVSGGALAVAEENRRRHNIGDRLRLLRSNLFSKLAGQRYDLIIANLPYVDADEMAGLEREFHYEPRLALEAGQDGLDLVRRLLVQSREHLNEGGLLVAEVGNSEAALVDAYPQLPFMWFEFEFGGHGVFLLTAEQLSVLS